MAAMTMIQALRSAMDVMLARDDNVVVYGQDVGYFGGVWPSSSEPYWVASLSAALTSASSACAVFSCSSSDQAPRPIRWRFSRAIGSPSG